MIQFPPLQRLDKVPILLAALSVTKQAQRFSKRHILRTAQLIGATLVALTFSGVAHTQGTMDFSGEQTLMGTFKTFAVFLHHADEGTLSRLLVESCILLAITKGTPAMILKDASATYKVDIDAIATKVRQEFVAKDKPKKKITEVSPKSTTKVA